MNGHPLVPTGIVPRVNATPAAPEAAPSSRAALAIEQLLEMERKAKAWDAMQQAYFFAGQRQFTGERVAADMNQFLASVKL